MPAWLIWAIAAAALAVGEILTPGLFFLGPVAVAAVIAGILALAGLGAVVQLLAFVAASIASVAVLRPLARSRTTTLDTTLSFIVWFLSSQSGKRESSTSGSVKIPNSTVTM